MEQGDTGSGALHGEAVSSVSGASAVLEKSFIVMNEKELAKCSNHKRTSKDPALKTVKCSDQQGNTEDLYIFKDPSCPWRTLRIQQSSGEHRSVELMAKALHERQGELTMAHAGRVRLQESSLASVMSGSQSLCTFEEYLRKLVAKKSGWHSMEQESVEKKGDGEEGGHL